MTKLFSTLVEISLQETILMLASQKRVGMTTPSFLEFPGLADVDTARMGVYDFVNSRFAGVFLIVKLHVSRMDQRGGFVFNDSRCLCPSTFCRGRAAQRERWYSSKPR